MLLGTKFQTRCRKQRGDARTTGHNFNNNTFKILFSVNTKKMLNKSTKSTLDFQVQCRQVADYTETKRFQGNFCKSLLPSLPCSHVSSFEYPGSNKAVLQILSLKFLSKCPLYFQAGNIFQLKIAISGTCTWLLDFID